ncbi:MULTISPECIES: DUF4440 domain-containing protein [Arenibacter]|uniref:DUF4440 domain-containing protein n=1 Tax=Arenibacter TaxID=178469 RepID=UPI0008585556|nr:MULTISPECIES: DUF4440 domain-containing protein [Arenibacter]GBF19384.1 cupin domain protein [Arenibacter sp. NBRC 103722]
MTKIRTINLILALVTITSLYAQESVFPKGKLAPNVHHKGDVWLSHVTEADETFDYHVAQAVSAPGAFLNWHIHPDGQQLLITNGIGYYQEKGKEVQVIQAGDVVKCLPNVEHWHGAAPNSPVTYLAISGKTPTVWTNELTQGEYDAIQAPNSVNEELLKLSKDKWQWMADKDTEKLGQLFHKDAQYVHMGGSWVTERELDIIKSGGIWYKKATVHEASVEVMDDTAVLLNTITLLAEVGGNEVSNPFIVTEMYKKIGGVWKLLNLSFVKQMVRE